MSSNDYMVWFLAMAVLIPVLVHGGTTWAYFRNKQEVATRPAVERAETQRHRTDAAPGINSDAGVPEKQIWRWQDDGGFVGV